MSDTFRKKYNTDHALDAFAIEIKTIAEELEAKFKAIGPSREISLAITNLENSVMWAVKALFSPKKEGDQE